MRYLFTEPHGLVGDFEIIITFTGSELVAAIDIPTLDDFIKCLEKLVRI